MEYINIDGDFSIKGKCKWYCYPECHPAQVGPNKVYGCKCPVWYPNRVGDFVPIVKCKGDMNKCPLKDKEYRKMIGTYISGKHRSPNYAKKKAERLQKEINEIKEIGL